VPYAFFLYALLSHFQSAAYIISEFLKTINSLFKLINAMNLSNFPFLCSDASCGGFYFLFD